MMEEQRNTKPENISEVVEFMGVDVAPSSVGNPHLRRVIEKTAKGGFRFRYDDHSRKRHSQYGDYEDWSKSKYHEEYGDGPAYHDHYPPPGPP